MPNPNMFGPCYRRPCYEQIRFALGGEFNLIRPMPNGDLGSFLKWNRGKNEQPFPRYVQHHAVILFVWYGDRTSHVDEHLMVTNEHRRQDTKFGLAGVQSLPRIRCHDWHVVQVFS